MFQNLLPSARTVNFRGKIWKWHEKPFLMFEFYTLLCTIFSVFTCEKYQMIFIHKKHCISTIKPCDFNSYMWNRIPHVETWLTCISRKTILNLKNNVTNFQLGSYCFSLRSTCTWTASYFHQPDIKISSPAWRHLMRYNWTQEYC